ncbi:acyl-CoA N-acyltransferase [Zychaea mexicana]|uniref:acyl-CoA N-acyltransferase n=1 Tax=Zychaea mexicana TaxID=64656 RepID=UPI0022FEC5A3|nr:acyl-CoA N-acyltransferase [Zychaea mexicana]KAI9496412.1 acyl-CoA N-acyltransferase [Zychaea mexicana]
MSNSPSCQNPQVYLATTPDDRKKCADVRVQVFVNELGCAPELESTDTLDTTVATLWIAACEHVDSDGTVKTIPVGTIRMLPYEEDDTVGVLSRLAALTKARGMRVGQKLVAALEDGAKNQGKKAIMIQGVADKRGFCEALGYIVEVDEIYIKDGLPHYKF